MQNMNKISVGDKVSFTTRTTFRPYLHSVTGTVVDLLPWTPCALAYVELDSGLMDKLVPVSALRVVEAVQDDVQDYLATCESPFRLIAEDYDEAIGLAGAMGTGVVEA